MEPVSHAGPAASCATAPHALNGEDKDACPATPDVPRAEPEAETFQKQRSGEAPTPPAARDEDESEKPTTCASATSSKSTIDMGLPDEFNSVSLATQFWLIEATIRGCVDPTTCPDGPEKGCSLLKGRGLGGSSTNSPQEELVINGRRVLRFGDYCVSPTRADAADATEGDLGEDMTESESLRGVFYVFPHVQGAGIESAAWNAFKDGRSKEADATFKKLFSNAVAAEDIDPQTTCFVPLLSSSKRESEATDTAYKLAQAAAEATGAAFAPRLLHRRGAPPGKAPRRYRQDERKDHFAGTFDVRKEVLDEHRGRTIILVDDDVYSGATLLAAANEPKSVGADYGITIKKYVAARYVGANRYTPTSDELTPAVRDFLAKASAVELERGGGDDAEEHAGVIYTFGVGPFVYVGSHIVPAETWADEKEDFLAALEDVSNPAEIQRLATKLGATRMNQHVGQAGAGKHNSNVQKWFHAGGDITGTFTVHAVVMNKAGETRKTFYETGLLPQEQLALNQLRAERDDPERDVEPLNVAWIAAGAGALLEKVVDPEDPEGPPVRRCSTDAARRKFRATWVAKPQAEKARRPRTEITRALHDSLVRRLERAPPS